MHSFGHTSVLNQEMAARTAALRTKDIWNVDPTNSRPRSLNRKEEAAADMPVTNEYHQFVMEAKYMRPTYVEMLCMINSALHVFQEVTVDRRIEEMVRAEVVSLLETANHYCGKGEKTTINQDVEKVLRCVVARGAVNDFIHRKVDNFAES